MALDFIRSKTKPIFDKINEISEKDPIPKTAKIEFYPYAFLDKLFRENIILLQDITNVNRALIFKYLMSLLEDQVKDCSNSNPLLTNQLTSLYTLIALIELCFSKIDLKEEFIPDEKKTALLDLWLLLTENVYGPNVNLVKKCFAEMLITVSRKSPTFFDGLTKTLQTNFQNKTSTQDFLNVLEPWVHLCNEISRLSSFLKVLTTNLTLVTSNYYPLILKTVCDIIMNTIMTSPEECKKFYDDNNTVMIALQVSNMIEAWDIKQSSGKLPPMFCLLLIQPTVVAVQVRDFSLAFLKQLADVKEIKSDNDMNALSAILKGFSAVAALGPQTTLNSFMMKFINLPTKYFIEMMNKKKDEIPHFIYSSVMIDFPLALIYMNVDLFQTTYADKIIESKNPTHWVSFGKLVQRICKFTSDKPYSFKQQLNALVPLICQAIKLVEKDPKLYKTCLDLCIAGFADNSLFSRLVFISHPDIYAIMMKLMKAGIIGGIDKLNSSLFNMTYVEDIQGPNFWTMLSTTLDTYISLSQNTAFLASPEFAQIPFLVELATEYVKALIKDGHDSSMPEPKEWENFVLRLEKIILFSLFKTETKVFKSTVSVINNYAKFVSIGSIGDRPLLKQFQLIASSKNTESLLLIAKYFRFNGIPQIIDDMYSNVESLFYSCCAFFDPKVPINEKVKVVKLNEKSMIPILNLWISSFTMLLCYSKSLGNDKINAISYFLHDSNVFGKRASKIISYSIPTVVYPEFIGYIARLLEQELAQKSLIELKNETRNLAINSMKMFEGLLEREDWSAQLFNEKNFSMIFKYLAHFANISYNKDVRIQFCEMVNLIMKWSNQLNKPILPKERFIAAKNMLQWIPPDSDVEKSYTKIVLTSINFILDSLSFFDVTDPVGDKAKATECFTLFFTFIKQGINKHSADVNDLLTVLTGIMKENFYLGINNCIAMGYDDDPKVRCAFLNGLTSFFSPEVYKKIVSSDIKEDLIDILMGGDFRLVKVLAQKMPYNHTDEFGRLLIQAAAYKSREFDFFQSMIELELSSTSVSTNEEEINRTRLFRGNGTPSKVFSAYAHMVAHQWLCDTITPIIQKVTAKVNQGFRFQIDQSRLEGNEDLKQNRENFRIIFQELVDQFTNHVEEMPTGLLKAAQLLYKSVVNQSQKVASQSIASFIFLRFICPTLPEPTKVGYTDSISEPVHICLIHLSTLLMIAAVHQKADQKRPHYAYFNDLVFQSYNKLQSIYEKIANKKITDVPLVTSIEPNAVKKGLQALILPIMPQVQSIKETLDPNDPLNAGIKQLQEKLQEIGSSSVKKEETVETEINIPKLQKLMGGQKLNYALLSTLETVFYKTQNVTLQGEQIFYLNLSNYLREYPIIYLLYHLIKTLKSVENEKFVVIADCGYMNTELLPSAKEISKYTSYVPDYIFSNLTHIYVVRLQSNLAKFIVESQILKSLPKLEQIPSLEYFRTKISPNINIFTEAAFESLLEPDSIHQVKCNKTKYNAYIFQHSIQLRQQVNIGFPFIANDVILLSSIARLTDCLPQPDGTMLFTILDKNDQVYQFLPYPNSDFYLVVSEVYKRDALVRTTRNLIYVERPTIRMLLLNVALMNLVSDTSDYATRQASLSLIQKTFVSTDLKYTVDVTSYSTDAFSGSVYNIAKAISEDIVNNNPDDAHPFITEFAKTMPYLNSNDYSIATTFLSPWMEHCGIEAVTNNKTLDALAQIIAMVPQSEIHNFEKAIWSSFNNSNLYKTLLLKSSEFGNSPFVSVFLTIAQNAKDVSNFISNTIEKEQNTAYFNQTIRIASGLVIEDKFKDNHIINLLHTILMSLFTGKGNSILNLFKTLYAKYVGDTTVITDEIVKPVVYNPDKKDDTEESAQRIEKCAKLIKEIAEAIPGAKEKLKEFAVNDTQSEDLVVSLGSYIILGVLADQNDNEIKLKIIKQINSKAIINISFISYAVSNLTLSDSLSCAVLCAGICLLAYSKHNSVVSMIKSALKQISKTHDLNKLNLSEFAQIETINSLEQIIQLPIKERPIDSIILLSLLYDKNHEITQTLHELNVKNDFLSVLFLESDYDQALLKSNHLQELCYVTLYKFIINPKNHYCILLLHELIEKNPSYFSKIPLDKALKEAQSANDPSVPKLLISLCKTLKIRPAEELTIPYYKALLDSNIKITVQEEKILPILEGIFSFL